MRLKWAILNTDTGIFAYPAEFELDAWENYYKVVGDIENPLAKIHEIKTMLYHANELAVSMGYDASVVEVGLSAQSVQRVQPEAVAPAPIDENYLTVRYERLVPLLIEAIKA